ncbi:hypothetical protein [uncultured Cyclobacterium sp.]|uniref:hypothetical protein n=1 Tax=uncultured Cyclobacterium sp. TaxID=453820 RepID=UPI0030EC11EA
MKTLNAGLKTFQSIQGYFIADRRTLHFIQLNRCLWDRASVISKIGTLHLTNHIPDTRLNEVQERFLRDDVRTGIEKQTIELFDILCEDLSFIREIKYVVSYLLCAHDPLIFPIWDSRRNQIFQWEARREVTSYNELKEKIDQCRSTNGCEALDYFEFNKLLWLCE